MGRILLFGFAAIFSLALTPLSPEARTWYVKVDGTGDVPHLEAAMDSAAYGDTVLVGPGEYQVNEVWITDGTYLVSEAGPVVTRLVPTLEMQPRVALACQYISRAFISGFWFEGYNWGYGFGVVDTYDCYYLALTNCIFTNNDSPGVYIDYTTFADIHHNTFINNLMSVYTDYGGGNCSYNIFWDPTPGLDILIVICNDFLRPEDIPPSASIVNFSADPLFCGDGDYTLQSNSPCAPGNPPAEQCGLIGALPVGCTPTPTEEHTWGSIKSLFEKP